MVTARLGQMVTLSPRWLAEQPLRRLRPLPVVSSDNSPSQAGCPGRRRGQRSLAGWAADPGEQGRAWTVTGH
jgi:hypothetical protein